MSPPRSILVEAPSWIGDGVMCLAALRALQSAYPGARLTVMARRGMEALYRACEAVDATLAYERDRRHRGLTGFLWLARELRGHRFDATVLFPNAFRSALLARLAGIPERWGYATDGRGWLLTRPVPPAPRPFGRHQTFYYLDLLRALGIACAAPDVHIDAGEELQQRARALLREHGHQPDRPLVGLHPGSTNSSAKRWLPERYARAGARVSRSLGAQLVVLGGPGEAALGAELASHLDEPPIALAGLTSLGELIGVLSQLSLLVSNDSGPMHLAAALSVPTVAVFGPTDERETGPFSPRSRVVRKPVECSPCLLKVCPIDHRCMTAVEVEDVCEAAAEVLSARPSAAPRPPESPPHDPRRSAARVVSR